VTTIFPRILPAAVEPCTLVIELNYGWAPREVDMLNGASGIEEADWMLFIGRGIEPNSGVLPFRTLFSRGLCVLGFGSSGSD